MTVARTTDPETSHQASLFAQPKARTHRDLALHVLRTHPEGLTDFELAAITGIPQTSIGVRRGELTKHGIVWDSGKRRNSPSGSPAIVWKTKP